MHFMSSRHISNVTSAGLPPTANPSVSDMPNPILIGSAPRRQGARGFAAMIGLQFAPIKTALGPLLNGMVAYELYVSEPTEAFRDVGPFLS